MALKSVRRRTKGLLNCDCNSVTSLLSKFLVSTVLIVLCLVSSYNNYGVDGSVRSEEIRLTPDGGYDIVVAIEPGTVEPLNVNQFVVNIEENFRNLSELMHVATKERFFVNSVHLVLPHHWQLTTAEGGSIPMTTTVQSYHHDADIRLSPNIDAPHVENPNLCGLPGRFIELPLNFFENLDGPYGKPERSLLTAWARYRFGVHEEHGYLGDKRFPYFYKKPNANNGNLWDATGCSNDEVQGNFQSLVDEANNDSCPLNDEFYPPGSDCRFIPTREEDGGIQTATSSFMYFHWLNSVTEFCDQTHNKDAPNKQNIFCAYKSVIEVMNNSLDARKLKGGSMTAVYPLNFTVGSASKLPLFYLLVDAGRFDIDPAVVTEIADNVKSLFNNSDFTDVIGQAAIFYASDTNELGFQIRVPWQKIGNNVESFIKVTNEFVPNGNVRIGNFALALEHVIQALRARRHPDGSIILVLKKGIGKDTYGSPAYEADLMRMLKEENINLHAIEIQTNIINPKIHLKNLAIESGGHHLAINPLTDLMVNVRKSVGEVVNKLLEMETAPEKIGTSGTLFKGFVPENSEFKVPFHRVSLPTGSVIRFSIVLKPNAPWKNEKNSKPLIRLPDNQTTSITFESEEFEWGDVPNAPINRRIITYNMTDWKSPFPTEWTVMYDGCVDPEHCTAFVVVSYDIASEEIAAEARTTSSGLVVNPMAPNLEVEVWTSASAAGDVVELTENDVVFAAPFILFAKISQKGSPVFGASVKAMMHNFDELNSLDPIHLMDDGTSSVDMMAQDGIYSASVHSASVKEDGSYRLTVEVSGVKGSLENDDDFQHMDSAVHRIIPIDQASLGCRSSFKECAVTGLDKDVAFVVDYERTIVVKRLPHFIARITDLDIEAKNGFDLTLTWKAPVYHGALDEPLTYTIKYSTDADILKTEGGFEGADTPIFDPDTISCPVSGETCLVTINQADGQQTYFAVRLEHATIKGDPSNVVGVKPVGTVIPTTTTTTTIAPPTTQYVPTKPYESTTPEVSTESSTEYRSTTEPDFLYWYEKTEGIIVLSVFGGGILLMGLATLAYCCFFKSKLSGARRTRNDVEPLQMSF